MQNMAEITSVSVSFTMNRVMICLTLPWLTDWLEESNSHQTEGLRRQEMRSTDSVFDFMRKPTEILKLSGAVKSAFRVRQSDPIYLNIRVLVFNTTIQLSHKAWEMEKLETIIYRFVSVLEPLSHLALFTKLGTWKDPLRTCYQV